jgi:MFS family permease
VKRIEWADAVRVLSLLVTAFFVAAAVLLAVLNFDLLGPPPPEQDDFIEETIDFFTWQQSHWPLEFAGTALFALGFTALGWLGVLLSRLADRSDARRVLTAGAFIGLGVIGAVSQLFWIGVKPIATSPQYCDCGLRQEEIMSRLMVLDVASGVQMWMVIGAIVLAAIGVTLAGGLGRGAGMAQGWVLLSAAIAVLSLASAVLGIIGAYPFDQLAVVLTAGVLLPIWALWLAIRVPLLRQPES